MKANQVNINKGEKMKTFEYEWRDKTVWQTAPFKKETISAKNIDEARKILHDKFYGFVKNPDCMFGGGYTKDTQEYDYNSLKEIKKRVA